MDKSSRIKYLVDFQDEADTLLNYISGHAGITRAFGEVDKMCILSLQDNVLRVLSGVDDIFVKEPLLNLETWVPTDILKNAVSLSKELAKRKLNDTLPKTSILVRGGINDYSNVAWLSEYSGVVY
jgi:hypothetical protein